MTANNGKDSRLLSEINVTPFVDVMLVLLVIFMVTAPLVQHGVDVDLPEAATRNIDAQEEHLAVTITKDQKIYINRVPVDLSRLSAEIAKIFQQRSDNQLYFRADKDLPYGFVIKVMAEIKNAGIEKLGIVTTPIEEQ